MPDKIVFVRQKQNENSDKNVFPPDKNSFCPTKILCVRRKYLENSDKNVFPPTKICSVRQKYSETSDKNVFSPTKIFFVRQKYFENSDKNAFSPTKTFPGFRQKCFFLDKNFLTTLTKIMRLTKRSPERSNIALTKMVFARQN